MISRRNEQKDDKAVEIIPRLYVGSLASARNVSNLQEEHITHIVSCIETGTRQSPDGTTTLYCVMEDAAGVSLFDHFLECFKYLDELYESKDQCGALIHCLYGMSRSVSLLIGYVMYSCGVSYDVAYYHVKRQRPTASPQRAFVEQLRMFESHLSKKGIISLESDVPNVMPVRSRIEHESRRNILKSIIDQCQTELQAKCY